MERFCNVLPVFDFNSTKYDINLKEGDLLPLLVSERRTEPIVIKKANQFVPFKFGDVQLLDMLNFLGGATSLDSFLKAYKTSETKAYFPHEWFDNQEKLTHTQLPPNEAFFSQLRNNNSLEKDYSDFQSLINRSMTSNEAFSKLKWSQPPPTGQKYQYLLKAWKQEKMRTLKHFLLWYNNNDVFPTLQAMQKMVDFYHSKGIDTSKLGCTLPNIAKICLHKSTTAEIYSFTESDKDLLEKIREDMVVLPSIVFSRKAVVGETLIRDWTNWCKTIVGIDASQLYPYSMCQALPTSLNTRWELDKQDQEV